MNDRRRVNGPAGSTSPAIYQARNAFDCLKRKRGSDQARPFYLKTGVTPSASGSAYFETEQNAVGGFGMKLCCTVHGPRSLPRSAPFSPHMVLSTHVKYAPFATRKRKGYMRDASERDLSVHLETALRGAIITDKWPKSGVDVVVTIIEDDLPQQETLDDDVEVWEMMTVLSGCITVASAAIVDAGIDCVDTVTGGVAALVASDSPDGGAFVVVDPVIAEHQVIYAACCVAYLPKRDEITNLWYRGSPPPVHPTRRHSLIAGAIFASKCAVKAVIASLSEPQSRLR